MKKKGEIFVAHRNSLFLTRPRRMVVTRQISSDLRQGLLLLLDQPRPFLAQGNQNPHDVSTPRCVPPWLDFQARGYARNEKSTFVSKEVS